jgi:hypothetical protein
MDYKQGPFKIDPCSTPLPNEIRCRKNTAKTNSKGPRGKKTERVTAPPNICGAFVAHCFAILCSCRQTTSAMVGQEFNKFTGP